MTSSRAPVFPCLTALLALGACGPKTVPANPPAPQIAAPAPPAKMETMVCRNSQTGASAECGTPNAVMVGMKER